MFISPLFPLEKTTINITHIFLKQDQDVYAKDVCESKLSD